MEHFEGIVLDDTLESKDLIEQIKQLLVETAEGICPRCGNPTTGSRCTTCS